jgi:plastocyanin
MILQRLAVALALYSADCVLAAELHAVVKDQRGQPVRDAVVVAVPEGGAPRGRTKLEEVEQIDQEFVPRVKAVLVGSSVSFPNRDDVRHHVYSFSPAKRFDLPLYVGTPANPVVFDTPGVVTIGCNIHDWMVGYIYVSESPYYGTSGRDGAAALAGLPAGRYSVRVWHPQLAAAEATTRRTLELQASHSVEWQLALKPEVRIRRSPGGTRGARY